MENYPNSSSQLNPIEEHIEECISKVASDGIKNLALQGGTFTPISYAVYNGSNVQYLCYKEPGTSTCIQKPLTRANIESQISNYVKTQIFTCLDLSQFEKDKRFNGLIIYEKKQNWKLINQKHKIKES